MITTIYRMELNDSVLHSNGIGKRLHRAFYNWYYKSNFRMTYIIAGKLNGIPFMGADRLQHPVDPDNLLSDDKIIHIAGTNYTIGHTGEAYLFEEFVKECNDRVKNQISLILNQTTVLGIVSDICAKANRTIKLDRNVLFIADHSNLTRVALDLHGNKIHGNSFIVGTEGHFFFCDSKAPNPIKQKLKTKSAIGKLLFKNCQSYFQTAPPNEQHHLFYILGLGINVLCQKQVYNLKCSPNWI